MWLTESPLILEASVIEMSFEVRFCKEPCFLVCLGTASYKIVKDCRSAGARLVRQYLGLGYLSIWDGAVSWGKQVQSFAGNDVIRTWFRTRTAAETQVWPGRSCADLPGWLANDPWPGLPGLEVAGAAQDCAQLPW